MSDVNKVYEEFWKFIIELDGEIDFEQVKRELYDYRIVMQEVSKVYCEITEGKFSKPNTKAEYIIEVVDEYNEESMANKAHQIIYKNIHEKLNGLLTNRTRFSDEAKQVYKNAFEKYVVGEE